MLAVNDQITLPVIESSQVAEARRSVSRLAQRLGFSETDVGKAALVVSEYATNLLKHTSSGGRLLMRSLFRNGVPGIEILVLDKGPGMDNIPASLRDGYSTAGSSGTGLGAIVRLSAVFDIYSLAETGTAMLSQVWSVPQNQRSPAQISPDRPAEAPSLFDFGAACVPYPGEEVCGDTWAVHQEINRVLILLVDGLGHGIGAAEAADKAAQTFKRNTRLPPLMMMAAIDSVLHDTRGAVAAVAEIDLQAQMLRFVGVGNLSAAVYDLDQTYNLMSHNGTVGYEMGRVQEFTYPFLPGALLIMHSDGCTSQLSPRPYPGLQIHQPALIAGVLYRDFERGRDDATVLVLKNAPSRTLSMPKSDG